MGELKKHMYLLKNTTFFKLQEHLAHCLPVGIELVFERNTSCNLGF
jgi:hypothetical protein